MTTATAPGPWSDLLAAIRDARDESKRRARSHRAKKRGLSPRLREMHAEYMAAREAWELAAETETRGYPEEMRLYREAHPAPTWQAWLVANRQERAA